MKTKRATTRKDAPLPEGVNKRLAAYTLAARAALPEDVTKRLAAYALAAGAAGVGVLALPEPAQADIIVSTTPIQWLAGVCGCSPGIAFLPVNGNNVLKFFASGNDESFLTIHSLRVFNPRSTSGAGVVPKRLANGALIGPGPFVSGTRLGFRSAHGTTFQRTWTYHVFGSWLGKSGYLGFKFPSKGHTHFGWADLKVGALGSGSISKFAYDTVPGQFIEAGQTSAIPEPGTLSLLALGAAGLAVLRRRKLSAASRQQSARRLDG